MRFIARLAHKVWRLHHDGVGLFQLVYDRPARGAGRPCCVLFFPEVPTGYGTFVWGEPNLVPPAVLHRALGAETADEVLKLCGVFQSDTEDD